MDVDASLATPSGDRAIGPVACRAHVGVRKQPSRPTTNFPARRPPKRKKIQKEIGAAGYRSPYLSHAKRALYHMSYCPP